MRLINLYLKFIIDYLLSIILIIVMLVTLVIISSIILLFDGKPIFFIQERACKYGRPFKMIKFKTIIKLYDKQKISNLGRFLRLTRLDEIPQIFNVLKGDLSLVGPRPLYLKYIKLYDKVQIKRLNMKPGITGWAQINGDNNISWKKKFDLDIWYINNFSFILDLKIILLTLLYIIKKILNFKYENKTKKIIDEEFNGKN